MSKPRREINSFKICSDNEKSQFGLDVLSGIKNLKDTSISDISKHTGIGQDIVEGYVNRNIDRGVLLSTGSASGNFVKLSDKSIFLGIGFSDDLVFLSFAGADGSVKQTRQIKIPNLLDFKGRKKEVLEIIDYIRRSGICTDMEADIVSAGIAIPEKLAITNHKSTGVLAEGIGRIFNANVYMAKEVTASGYGEKEITPDFKGKDILYMYSDIGTGVVFKKEHIFEAVDESDMDRKYYLRSWDQFNIVDTAKTLVNKGVGSSIVNIVDGEVDDITLEVVLKAAEDKDELAMDLVRRSALALGVRAAYLVNMFNVDTMVLGGGTERDEGKFMKFVKESAYKFILENKKNDLEIVPARRGYEAASLGAAFLCLRELFMEV